MTGMIKTLVWVVFTVNRADFCPQLWFRWHFYVLLFYFQAHVWVRVFGREMNMGKNRVGIGVEVGVEKKKNGARVACKSETHFPWRALKSPRATAVISHVLANERERERKPTGLVFQQLQLLDMQRAGACRNLSPRCGGYRAHTLWLPLEIRQMGSN